MTKETNTASTGRAAVDRAALPIIALAFPMILETFFRMLVSSVDTFMLSSYNQEAVAGVGLVSQYVFFVQVLFNVICIGTSIVLSQYLGANRKAESRQVVQASVVMVSVTAITLCLGVCLGAGPLLSLYKIESSVRNYAWQYLVLYGGIGSLFIAFNMLQGTVLRSYGYARDAMFITFAANLINVVGNSLALYGWFGLPVTGVVGVAISSVVSQLAACVLLAWRIRANPEVEFPFKGFKGIPRAIYRRILSIGIPTAGENLSYNVASIALMAMLSTLGTYAMSAQIYALTLVRFVFATAMALGNAVQIKTGYYVGAKRPEEAYRRVYRYQIVGTAISLVMIAVLNLIKAPLIGLFTQEKAISELVYTLLFFSIYVEFGRSINLVTIPALKGAGDVKFPVLYGICSNWILMVGGSWLLGIHAGLGLVGFWLAIGTDETTRGIVMLFRWKSKRWQTKAIQ
jgi:putative MATE family efflux protein